MNCDDGSLVHPLHEYANSGGDCSVTGGHVHRGGIPALQGRYLFADYCSGKVWAYDPGTDTAALILTDQNLGSISSFGEDALGRSYLCTWSRVWRIEEDLTDAPLPIDQGLRLAPPSPNPFRGRTEIRLKLEDEGANLELAVYAVDGRRLRSLHSGAAPGGELALTWDGRDAGGRRLPAGVYLLQASNGGASSVRRLTLLR